ncbi:MAG: 16S rRNA (guanine(527)-N(7))-methyltransferase RsmG [Clostridia bacterium]|nr:16S rRNA (guanine(527)-N(7))-methyltransferase RsmG [Clostridia bacterium]
MTDYSSLITDAFAKNGLEHLLSRDAIDKFNILIDRMITVNENMNLTAIKDPVGIVFKHIVDSAAIVPYIPQNAKLLDVGTGGGFPLLPVAILRSDIRLTGLDSTAKKLRYIDETADILGLTNVKTLTGRAEELGHNRQYRGAFGVVTARAVASLNVLCELCIPFVKENGIFLSMKGAAADEEIKAAISAASQLGASRPKDNSFPLLCGDEQLQRHIISFTKIKPTPENFPRAYNRISKKPL